MTDMVWPMLAKATTEASLAVEGNWDGYILEPKLDGMRAVVIKKGDDVKIFSRSGKPVEEKVPHLVKVFKSLNYDFVVDGELGIIADTRMISGQWVPLFNFNHTMRALGSLPEKAIKRQEEYGQVEFVLFDVMEIRNQDVRKLSYTDRQVQLFSMRCLDMVWSNARFTDDTRFLEIYKELVAAGGEGGMLKKRTSIYVDGKRPNKTWVKIKKESSADVVVMGYTEGTGKYAGLVGAIKFGAYNEDGELVYVGRCSGMNDQERRDWTANFKLDSEVFKTVIEVKFNELVGSGTFRTPRHPQYMHIRMDRLPESCKMDQFKVSE